MVLAGLIAVLVFTGCATGAVQGLPARPRGEVAAEFITLMLADPGRGFRFEYRYNFRALDPAEVQ